MLWETSQPQASWSRFTICTLMGLSFPTYTMRQGPRPGLLRDQGGNRRKGRGLMLCREWGKQRSSPGESDFSKSGISKSSELSRFVKCWQKLSVWVCFRTRYGPPFWEHWPRHWVPAPLNLHSFCPGPWLGGGRLQNPETGGLNSDRLSPPAPPTSIPVAHRSTPLAGSPSFWGV